MYIQYCGYCQQETEFIWTDNFKGKCSKCRAPSGFSPSADCLPGTNDAIKPWTSNTHLHDNEEADKNLLIQKSQEYKDPEEVKEVETPEKKTSELTVRVLDEDLKMGFQIKPEPMDEMSEIDKMFLADLIDFGVEQKDAKVIIKAIKTSAEKMYNSWKTQKDLEALSKLKANPLDGVFENGSVIIFGEHKDKQNDPSAI